MKLEAKYEYRMSMDNDMDGVPFRTGSLTIEMDHTWYKTAKEETIETVVKDMVFTMLSSLYNFRACGITVTETKVIK